MTCFSTDCATFDIPVNFQSLLPDGPQKMNGGIERFGLIKADCTFTDIYDPAEWAAKKAAGDVQLSPCGAVTLGAGTTATTENECGQDEVDETTYTPTFSMTKLDPVGLTHVKYLCELVENTGCMNVFFCDCNENMILNYNWMRFLHGKTATAPTGCPGIPFSIPINPNRTKGNNNRLTWSFGMEIVLDGNQFLGESLLPGVCAALAV